MKIISNKYLSIVIRCSVICFFVMFFYSGYTIVSLIKYSNYVEKIYNQNNLKGKDIQSVIDLFGWPRDGIKHNRVYARDINYKLILRGKHTGHLTYYTDNWMINKIGWFPFGGCSIGFDENDVVVGFNEYLD